MWLLDTQTLELHEFFGDKTPEYAILSHRWEEEEVSFDQIKSSPRHLKGYKKIKAFCDEALRNGYKYGWVDTCCIDKRSSAELSEAINSMYRWYERSAVCYAYLSDVKTANELTASLWFTRGWTLQELIAPRTLIFYSSQWVSIGTKTEFSNAIATHLRISSMALLNFSAKAYSVAERMSWTYARKTTREEDQAYCLLGLLETNMSMLYGEGAGAFRRLQDEMMRQNSDLSIFLWHGAGDSTFGMLAESPQCFGTEDSSDTEKTTDVPEIYQGRNYLCHNGGIEISVLLYPFAQRAVRGHNDFHDVYTAYLEPAEGFASDTRTVRILLAKKGRIYKRVAVEGVRQSQVERLRVRKKDTASQILIAREALEKITLSDIVSPRLILTVHYGRGAVQNAVDVFPQHADIHGRHDKGINFRMETQQCSNHPADLRDSLLHNDLSSYPRLCQCATYFVEPRIGHLPGFFCWTTVTGATPFRVCNPKLKDFARMTIYFGFDRDLNPIHTTLPFTTPFTKDEMDPMAKVDHATSETMRSALASLTENYLDHRDNKQPTSQWHGLKPGYISAHNINGKLSPYYGLQGPWRLRPFPGQRSMDCQFDLTFDVQRFYDVYCQNIRSPMPKLTTSPKSSGFRYWRRSTGSAAAATTTATRPTLDFEAELLKILEAEVEEQQNIFSTLS